jgi:hypothetical protein
MDMIEIAPPEQEYQPTVSQLERAAAIRRFNFRFVYLPIGLITLVVLVTVIGLIYLAIFPPNEETLNTISGMADAATILGIIPLLLLCAIIPTLAVVATVQGKRRGIAPILQLQLLFWRLDGAMSSLKQTIGRLAQKLANPFITIQAALAFVRSFLRRVASIFKQG